MRFLRFMCSGRINKPFPQALVDVLPSIKVNAAELQTYARKINEGKHNEEATNVVTWGNETESLWFQIDLAIPMPLPQALQDKLPAIKDKLRLLKTYAVSTGIGTFHAGYHICRHEEGLLCESEVEI